MNPQVVASLVVVAVGGFFVFLSFFFRGFSYGSLGPSFWPRFICLALMFLGVLDMLQERRNPASTGRDTASQFVRVLPIVGLFLAYAVLNQVIGFLLSTVLFQAALLWILERRLTYRTALLPLCLTALLYVLFVRIMYIPFPRGVWLFRHISTWFY